MSLTGSMINWVRQVQIWFESSKNVWVDDVWAFQFLLSFDVCACAKKNDKWQYFQMTKRKTRWQIYFHGIYEKWFFKPVFSLLPMNLILFWVYIDINNRLQMIGLLEWNVKFKWMENERERKTKSAAA